MIEQRDLSGNLINTYFSKADAARSLGVNESTIRYGIRNNSAVMGKFKFNRINSEETNHTNSKILLLDIESSPILAYTWALWKQDIHLDQIVSNWFILSWSAKWLGEDNIMGMVLLPHEVIQQDDNRVISELWKLLNQAEIIIAHSGDKFDIPRINSRFIVNGLNPPSPYKQIDTLKIARSMFGFSSNKLDALARIFGFEGKKKHDMELWVRCMRGNMDALLELSLYNDQDIVVLENIYLKLRPYIKSHPNLDLYIDSEAPTCPHCSSVKIHKLEGKYFYTQANRYETYRCSNCGAISRSKEGTKFQYKKLISPIPR